MAAFAGDSPALSSDLPHLELPNIRAALASTLEGEPAQLSSHAEAAVVLLLRSRQEQGQTTNRLAPPAPVLRTDLLLIRRAQHPRDPWSGHMALPGGRRAPTDSTLLHTAQRETFEEIGLQLERDGILIGRLPPLPAVAQGRPLDLMITPLVFELAKEPKLKVNHEVSETLWVPLDDLSSGKLDSFVDFALPGASTTVRLPAWTVQGRVVWGLTHRMIVSFFGLLGLARSESHTSSGAHPTSKASR